MPGDQLFSAVTSVDIDGDGLRDVVIRDTYGGGALLEEAVTLTIVRGADAAFEARARERFVGARRVTAGGGLEALGDWDGDGVADLGVQYEGVLLTGDGLTETTERCYLGLAIGDVDGDGSDDSACFDGPGVAVRLGGVASPMVREVVFDTPVTWRVPAGDVDADGVPEILVDTGYGWWLVDVIDETRTEIGEGTRSFVAIGDVDGDGADDLVGRRGDDYHLWRGGEGGPREDERPFARSGEVAVTIRPAGDANCDGYRDVFIVTHVSGEPDRIALHAGTPEGISSAPVFVDEVADGTLLPIFD